ncbi:beta-galactosidase GanA [Thermoanaerobacterium thermosulfurigenes]
MRVIPLYSGTVHYWRIDRSLWEDILINIKKNGF